MTCGPAAARRALRRVARSLGAQLLLHAGFGLAALAQGAPAIASLPDAPMTEPANPDERLRWGGLVLPLFGANSTDGAGFGLGGELFARPRSMTDGYVVKLQALGWVTTSWQYTSDYIQVDYRGDRVHWLGRAGYRGWSNLAYGGSGGADVLLMRGDEELGNTLRAPFAFLGVATPIGTNVKLYGQLYARQVSSRPGEASLLDERRPFASDGGFYTDTTVGVEYDTTDRWPMPVQGWRAEIGPRFGVTRTPDGAVSPLVGLYAEAIRWQPLIGERLVLGARAVFDRTIGRRPYFEQEVAGGRWRDELGSEQALAGYGRTRTRGDGFAAIAVELRPLLFQVDHSFFDLDIGLSFAAEEAVLFDGPRVGPHMPTLGAGPYLTWKGAIQLRPMMNWGWRADTPGGPRRPVPQFVISFTDPL